MVHLNANKFLNSAHKMKIKGETALVDVLSRRRNSQWTDKTSSYANQDTESGRRLSLLGTGSRGREVVLSVRSSRSGLVPELSVFGKRSVKTPCNKLPADQPGRDNQEQRPTHTSLEELCETREGKAGNKFV